MRAFVERLPDRGQRVVYLKLDDPQNHQTIAGNITDLRRLNKLTHFEYLLPDGHRLNLQLQELLKTLPVFWQALDTQPFS
jgi:deoxyribodipyrimidine photolyase-related protein